MSVSLVEPLMLHQLLGLGPAAHFSAIGQPLRHSNSHCGNALRTLSELQVCRVCTSLTKLW